ncbi:hypothetical protein MKW98_012427, partial [Papaver atlanticum]
QFPEELKFGFIKFGEEDANIQTFQASRMRADDFQDLTVAGPDNDIIQREGTFLC